MSLLLDALRKSEQRRQGGQPPPLGLPTGAAAGERARAPRRRGSGRWIAGLLVLCVLAAGTWWALGLPGLERAARVGEATPVAVDRAPEPVEQALQVPAYRAPEPSPPPQTAAGSGPSDLASVPTEPMPVSEPANEPANAPTRAATELARRPEPVTEPASRPDPSTPSESDGRPTEPAARPNGAVAQAAAGDPAGSPVPDEPPSSPPGTVAPERAAPRLQPVAPESRPPGEVRNEPAARDDTILPWELPAALRAEFPAIDVAVHVYAPQPEARFVLIDGERYVEGDALGGGAQLAEIRRRGIVVDFRNYRVRIE